MNVREIAVPALHLSEAPWKYPFATHARAFFAHVVYGCVTQGVRRVETPLRGGETPLRTGTAPLRRVETALRTDHTSMRT